MSLLLDARRVIGNESYSERFLTFLGHTNQKIITSRLIEILLSALNAYTGLLDKNIVSMLDFGCGEGTLAKQLIRLLRQLHRKGIHYTGLDHQHGFVIAIKESLSSLEDPLLKVDAYQANLFSNQPLHASRVDIVVASHMLYYCYDPNDLDISHHKARAFMKTVFDSLLHNSIAIMIHESCESDVRELGTRFGSMIMPDPPGIIDDICQEGQVVRVAIPFQSLLRFPELSDTKWKALESTETL